MLKRFAVKNYKNFQNEIGINFDDTSAYQFNTECITDGLISKMLIYGRNATGKTNLGDAIMNIKTNIFGESPFLGSDMMVNADSGERATSFSYTFCFGNEELVYNYTCISNQGLETEELIINNQNIFRCNFSTGSCEFINLGYINADTANTDRYLQSLKENLEDSETGNAEGAKLPFLKWLISNVALVNNSVLIKLANYVKRMSMVTVGTGIRHRRRSYSRSAFYDFLKEPEKLQDLEDFFNAMGIECQLVLKSLPDGRSELYFKHKSLVPFFETASSGTYALLDLYRFIIGTMGERSFIYLDEFDAFYHYEMAESVVRFFKDRYPHTQIIMTSHNTNLMTNSLMRPDCIFILSQAGTLTALCDATERELREGHNLEKMYISGEFNEYE